jgi:hypothetical protein
VATQKSSKKVAAVVNSQGSGGATTQNTGSPPPTAATKAPTGFRLQLQQMLAGIQAVIPDGSSIPGQQGTMLAKADIVSQLGADLGEFNTVDSQELGLKQARTQLIADEPAMRTYYNMLKTSLVLFYGKGSPQLAQFGVSAKLRRPSTPAEDLARAAKAKQTRTLRHTAGAKQKAQLQFQGTVVVSATANANGPASTASPSNAGAEAPQAAPEASVSAVAAEPAPAAAVASPGGTPPAASNA